MSPVSRSRKGRRSRTKSRSRAELFALPDACDCPACTGELLDAEFGEMIDHVVEVSSELPDDADLLDAQMMAGSYLTMWGRSGGGPDELVAGLIPALEATATNGALNLLLATAAVADEPASSAAAAAADRLVQLGLRRPTWAADVKESVTADCMRLYDADENMSILVGTVHRAGRSASVLISVDQWHCGAANHVVLLEEQHLAPALKEVRGNARRSRIPLREEKLEPAEFRWQAEAALDARRVHDEADAALEFGDRIDDDIADDIDEDELDGKLDFQANAAVVRSLLRQLPESGKPEPSHDERGAMGLLAGLPQRGRAPRMTARRAPRSRVDLPPKRKKSAGPAPVYQLKVSLRGAQPPIWRRLQVPSDPTLDRLHDIIQIAFNWDGSHLHVFQTPYGEFGLANKDLGHQADSSVSLGQVAPAVGDRFRYQYDFGDDWDHDVLVEKVLGPGTTNGKARCTGGRRAAPPDDCGGIWGYSELVDILADPSHPDYEDRLEWLGLGDGSEFDPDDFKPDAVNALLSRLG